MTGDRDLLYAVLVQHLGYADATHVVNAGLEWADRKDKGVTMRQVLRERQLLSDDQAKLVDALVTEAVRQAGNDVQKLPETLPPALRRSFDSVSMSLTGPGLHSGAGERTDPEGHLSIDSLEAEANVGTEAPSRYTFDTGELGRTEELGKGGVGRVVVAFDGYLGRQVAMKEIRKDFSDSPHLETHQSTLVESRFLREARLTGQLEHPAIVPVYELARHKDGSLYYTMPRIRGRTMAQALSDARTLDGRLAFLPDFITLCRAVDSAHHQGVIHRDLKPQNVMLGAFGETRVMDWGLARVQGKPAPEQRAMKLAPDVTGGQAVGAVGTPSYMSPEQAFGALESIDERSDVWGLGAVLFEILTGKPPFDGKSPWDVLARVRTASVPLAREVEPSVPPELEAIARKALRRDKELRYATAGAMADDVQAWLDGGRVSVYEYSVREVTRRLFTRHRLFTLTAATVVVAALMAFGFTAVQVRRERDEARAFARFFLTDVFERLESVAGAGELTDKMLESSLEAFRQSVDEENGPRDERLLLARFTNRLGVFAWRTGKGERAREAYGKSERTARALVKQYPNDADAHAVLAGAVLGLSDLEFDEGRAERTGALLQEALTHARRATELNPTNDELLSTEARVQGRLAFLSQHEGRLEEALAAARRARELNERRLALTPGALKARVDLADTLLSEGGLLVSTGAPESSMQRFERAADIAREVVAEAGTPRTRQALGDALGMWAETEEALGRTAQSQKHFEESLRVMERLLKDDPRDVASLYQLTLCHLHLGHAELGWQAAEQLRESGAGGEYVAAIISAAFASGRDDELLAMSEEAAGASKLERALYQSLASLLRGDVRSAAPLARQAAVLSDSSFEWAEVAVRERVKTAPAATREAIDTLVAGVERGRRAGTREARSQAIVKYAAAVEALAAKEGAK